MTSTNNATNINADGLVIFESSNGSFSGVELDTKGDILTRTSSVYSKLGVGSDAEVLISDSAELTGLNYAVKASGSSITLLQSETASSSSTVDMLTGWDDSIYAYYIFTYQNVRPSSDGRDLLARFTVNGGSSYLSSNYEWVVETMNSSTGSKTITADYPIFLSNPSTFRIASSIGNDSSEGISGRSNYFPSSNTSSTKYGSIVHDNTYVNSSGIMIRNFGSAINTTSSIVNGIRFAMSSGNIATGIFKMYGVSKV